MPSRAAKTPSSTPPTGSPLSKRQRQRQQREVTAMSSQAVSPGPASPLASSPPTTTGIIIPDDRLSPRASPSKYPTPLPDEVDDEPLPVPQPISVVSVPEGALVDIGIEDTFLGQESTTTIAPQPMLVAVDDDVETFIQQPASEPTPDRHTQSVPEPPYPPTPQSHHQPTLKGSRRRSSRHSSSPGPSRVSDHLGYGQSPNEDGHMRVPQAPRSHATAPRALSALSAALRTVQAVTSTATAYASSGYTNYQHQSGEGRRASMHYSSTNQRNGHSNESQTEEDEDEIVGARWAECGGSRLLILAYAGGVQVWDTSSLSSIKEVANICIPGGPDDMKGPVLSAAVLPGEKNGVDIGILTPHSLYIFNLTLGRVVVSHPFRPFSSPSAAALEAVKDEADANHRRRGSSDSLSRGSFRERKITGRRIIGESEDAIGTPSGFEATCKVVLVITHSPPALVILARSSLQVLHVVPSGLLAVPQPLSSSLGSNSASSSYGSSPPGRIHPAPLNDTPNALHLPRTPVAALNGRLLAFLAQPSDLASGVESPTSDSGLAGWGRTLGRFFSRSAPAASNAVSMLGGSPVGNAVLEASSNVLAAAGLATIQGGAGSWVRIVDLEPLIGGKHVPRDLHAFTAGKHPVGGLYFEQDGTRLVVVRRDGLGAGVWVIRPTTRHMETELSNPVNLYKLRRGRTNAVIETVAGSHDGRFIALSTRRRTVHVFAVNPYGGKADLRSHLMAQVRDAELGPTTLGALSVLPSEKDGPPTDVHALTRMHLPAKSTQHVGESDFASIPLAPLAISFVSISSGLPTNPLRSPASPASPSHAQPNGVQEVLVFDPVDGILTLRRITLTMEVSTPLTMGVPLPVSMSLPTGRLIGGSGISASPPAYPSSFGRGGSTQQAIGPAHGSVTTGGDGIGAELSGKESAVATWNLRRRKGWAEIRRTDIARKGLIKSTTHSVKEDWLSQAELSTFSTPRVLPRPIYLTHQFAFYTLGEDYHALIRRYQLGLRGAKIDVRREVEVSGTYASGGEAFVEGIATSSSPRAIHRRNRNSQASFDEPLASALAGAQYALPPPVLPMLPNGTPSSFRGSIPIRAVAAGLGDGVAEGIGRIKREMRHQRQRQLARSPPIVRHVSGDDLEASVPLEFDEEDEDFIGVPARLEPESFLQVHVDGEEDDLSANTSPSRTGGDSVLSISTPATSAQDEMELDESGWGPEDKLAVEEAERFDDISVVGFLDEEQQHVAETIRPKPKGSRGRKRRN